MQSFVFGDFCRLEGFTGKPIEPVVITHDTSIQLKAARNEYASFQLAVEDAPLKDIVISASFEGGLEASVYYEWFHRVQGETGEMLVPDMLV